MDDEVSLEEFVKAYDNTAEWVTPDGVCKDFDSLIPECSAILDFIRKEFGEEIVELSSGLRTDKEHRCDYLGFTYLLVDTKHHVKLPPPN